jgi:protein-disulfide isomerase
MKHYKFLLIALVVVAAAVPVLTKKSGEAGKAAAPVPTTQGGQEVIAYLHGEPIYTSEVDALIVQEIMKLREQEYQKRRSALDQLLEDRVMEEEAQRRGMTVNDLINTEIVNKSRDITEQEIATYYEAFKDDAAIRGKSLEEAEAIIRQSLVQKRMKALKEELLDGLYTDAGLKVVLVPPRIDVPIPEGEPTKGPADAPITIVEFSDFECGYCKRVEKTVDQLLEDYPGKIRVIYRDFPIRNHMRAEPAAMAARCAGDQGKYWEYHANLFQVSGNLLDDDLKNRAEQLGLDMVSFNQCYDNDVYKEAVRLSFAQGSAVGVKGTPTFFINGRRLAGAKPIGDFKEIIDEELALLEGS